MEDNKPNVDVTKQEACLLLLNRLDSVKQTRQRLQPYFHPILIQMMEELVEQKMHQQIKQGIQPTIKNVTKLVEREFSEWVISQNPPRAEELIQQALTADE